MLASEKFHRFATRFPLTRPIARHQARELFDLVAGFVYSQILYACVRLNVFDVLAHGPLSTADLAEKLNLSPDATERLMAAARSLKLIENRKDKWGLGILGGVMVGNRAISALVMHHAALYADLRDPVALLRGETDPALAAYWPYADERTDIHATQISADRFKEYSELMSASQPLVAGEILDSYDFSSHRLLLDMGGGAGTFISHAAKRCPHLKFIAFDLPAVAQIAQKNFLTQGIADRAQAVGGSFFDGDPPRGADIVTLIRVLYDHDDHRALRILKAARRALSGGGTLLIAEPMSATTGALPMGDAYFGFYLLAMGKGRSRSAERLSELLIEAGFTAPKRLKNPLPIQAQILISRCGAA